MDDALEAGEWQQVVRFQNYCSQKEGGRSGNTDYYMEPTLFWNYIFDRDFPLGVAVSPVKSLLQHLTPTVWRPTQNANTQ